MKNVVLVKMRSYISTKTPPIGIGYLLKVLKEIDGINPVFIDMQRDDMEEEEFLDKIKILKPLIIGFQVFSVNYAKFRNLVAEIKRLYPKIKIVAGGPHISGLPSQVMLENPGLDYGIRGEGEEALKLLVHHILNETTISNLESIPNIIYRDNGKVVMNKIESVDINKYGYPAWDIIEPDKYPAMQHGTFHKSTKVVPILTSRGCPHPCTYCAGHLNTGKLIRRRDINNIVEEIQFLQSTYGFEEFIIEDENFTFYKDHVINLSNEIKKRNIKCYFSFPNGIRLDRLDEEVVYHLKRMGTYVVCFGIESGSKRTLKNMNKNWDLDMVIDKIKLVRKNGITVLGSFILGFSGETMEDINMTVDFALKSGIDLANFGNYIPLAGTEDFNRMVSTGELKLDEIDWESYTSYNGRIPYHPKAISEEDLLKVIKWATIRFYLRPKIMFNFIKKMYHPVFVKSAFTRLFSLFGSNRKQGGMNDGMFIL